jgi:site-specific recombinase XerD
MTHPRSCAVCAVASKLKLFLDENKLNYSKKHASIWLNTNKNDLFSYKNSAQKYLNILDDIITKGYTTILVDQKDRLCYKLLPDNFRQLVDNFLMSINFSNAYKSRIRQSCSHILRYINKQNINSLNNLPINLFHDFLKIFKRRDSVYYFKDISMFLGYLCNEDIINKIDLIKYNQILNPVPVLNSPTESEYIKLLEQSKNDKKVLDIKEFDILVKSFNKFLSAKKYSLSQTNACNKVTNEFKIYIIINKLPYSNSIQNYWLELGKKSWKLSKYTLYRRTLLCLNDLLAHEMPKKIYIHFKGSVIPKWSSNELNNYVQFRSKELLASSTVTMIKSSCNRFLLFLEYKNIYRWEDITPLIVKEFHRTDQHSSNEGHNAYTTRIRGFLKYLADKGFINQSIPLALPTTFAPKLRIVKILSEDQLNKIHEYRKSADSPMKLRHSAIVMLGIGVGLRASDIVKLQLTDISWKKSVLSIIQTKTKKKLTIPLSFEVINSLLRYINEGRPKNSTSNNIFISHSAPYDELSSSSCYKALKSILQESLTFGFHITRKTFASKLLSSGNFLDNIANALGHSDTSRLGTYLSTDIERMRMCPLNLEGLEYSGDLNL